MIPASADLTDPRNRLIEILQRQTTDLQRQNSDLRTAIDDLRDQMDTLTALLPIEALIVAATGLRPLLVSPVGRLASTAEIYVDAMDLDAMTAALKAHDLLLPNLPVPDRALDRLSHTYIRVYFPALRTAVLDRAGTHRSHLLDRALAWAPRDPIGRLACAPTSAS
ncbi:hypothetical protein HK101_006953, partial [Irineochytrium annulatum]